MTERRGATLAGLLNSLIDARVNDDTSRSDVIEQMASAAGIDSGTVNQILRGDINCPPPARIEGFAEALNVSASRLFNAAGEDGCEFDRSMPFMSGQRRGRYSEFPNSRL